MESTKTEDEIGVLQAIFQNDVVFDLELLWLTFFINKKVALEIFLDGKYCTVNCKHILT